MRRKECPRNTVRFKPRNTENSLPPSPRHLGNARKIKEIKRIPRIRCTEPRESRGKTNTREEKRGGNRDSGKERQKCTRNKVRCITRLAKT